jgi:hypothetical protein
LVLLFAPWFSFACGIFNFDFRIFHLWISNFLHALLQILLDFSFGVFQLFIRGFANSFGFSICGFSTFYTRICKFCWFGHLWIFKFVFAEVKKLPTNKLARACS